MFALGTNMKLRSIVRISLRGIPLIPIALMAVAIAAAVLAANTQIVSTVTIQTFAMQANTVSANACTTTALTNINYGVLPTGQPLPNTSFCLRNTSASPVYTGGATITAASFTITGTIPPGMTEDWVVAASATTACVGVSVPTSLTISATAATTSWTVTSSNVAACNVGATISYFTLSHTGTSTVTGSYTWTSTLNAYTTATG
jgi:hypothetical protein